MIKEAIAKVSLGRDMSEEETAAVMTEVSEGRATPAQIGALLMGLRMKGETVAEITATARVLASKCVPVPATRSKGFIVDTCGTGGDMAGTFNVSTTAAFVAAGCGLKTAKHGNRSVSSRCGSADVIEALGVNLVLSPEDVGLCLDRIGLGFLFAPLLHPAMGHAVHPRREVGLKSIFNLAGPLTNPVRPEVQVLGVFRPDLTETLARVLDRLGRRRAFVVHGREGLDEISLSGPTLVSRLHDGRVSTFEITPEDAGLERAGLEEVKGGDAKQNAAIVLDVLSGRPGPCREMVLLNTAAVLVAADKAGDLREGVALAAEAVDDGRAMAKLEALVELSRDLRPPQRAAG